MTSMPPVVFVKTDATSLPKGTALAYERIDTEPSVLR